MHSNIHASMFKKKQYNEDDVKISFNIVTNNLNSALNLVYI